MLTGTGHNYSTLKNNFSPSFYNNHGGDEDDQETPHQAPVVQKLDSTIHRINLYPVDNC